MRRILLAAAVLAAATAAQAQQPTSKAKAGRDAGDALSAPVGQASAATLGAMNASAYVANAARSDMYEIEAGKLAQSRAQDPKVKDFAAQMVKDHTATTQMIKGALPANVKPPTALDKRREGMLDDLKQSKAGEFDKRYVKQQVAAHQEALTLHQGYADRGDNAGLKQVAGQIAPKVKMHLDMARMLPGAQ